MRLRFNKKAGGSVQKSMRLGSRLGMTLFGAAFFAGGAFFLYMMVSMVWSIFDSYSWIERSCQVVENKIEETSNREDPYRVRVRYSYEYLGKQFASKRISFNGRSFDTYLGAERFAALFPEGGSVSCLVNPNAAEESILQRDSLWILVAVPLPLVFILVGGAIMVGAWWPDSPESEAGEVSSRGVGFKKKSAVWPVLKYLLFFLCIIGGAIGTYYLGFLKVKSLYEAERWPSVQGAVLSSRVIENRGDDSTTYRGYVAYSYNVDGREYKNDQVAFMSLSSSCYSCARKIVRNNPKGGSVRVFFNPANPAESVLDRNWRWSYLLGFLPAIFFFVGIFGLYGSKNKATPLVGQRSLNGASVQDMAWAGSFPQASQDARTGLYDLRPAHSSMTKFVVVLLFTLFWNTIVFWVAIDSGFSFNLFALFNTLFMVPFVLVGLGMLVLSAYMFFGLWSPKIHILVPQLRFAPGNAYSCKWTVDGAYSKIQSLEVSLQAEEKIYYNSGDDRSSKDRTVFSERVFQSNQNLRSASGEFEVSLPVACMHTLDTPDTKLVWSLQVKADVAGLPDVKENIVIYVGRQ